MIQVIDAGPVDTYGEKGDPGLAGLPGLKGQKGEKGMYFVLSFWLSDILHVLIKRNKNFMSLGALYDSGVFQLFI